MELILRERGAPVAVSPNEWRNLRLEETVGALARNGILRIERTSAAVILTPKNFVGEMRAPNISLAVLPKDKALYEAMLGLAVRFDGREAQHHSEKSNAGEGADLATPFVEALAGTLEDGLPWKYDADEELTSQPRGKIQIGKTITQFISKGVFHRVIANRSQRKQLMAFVNVVWAAYLGLSLAPGSTPTLVARAARLVEALDPQDAFDVPEIVTAATDYLGGDQLPSDAVRTLVRAALSILNHDCDAGHSTLFLPSGVARFANLERIWERAVAELVAQAVQPQGLHVAMHGLAAEGLKLFGNAGPIINPDVTAFTTGGLVELVADAKYKILSNSEFGGIAADVYQLTCYVNRTKAKTGILVYLGSKDSVVALGKTECGASIIVVAISSETLKSHTQSALAHLLD